MGTLGEYLRSAREKRGIDLRDAAQQTRISLTYLKALEEEDFSKLPGEVFVRGFLKNYGKFLRLEEVEVMRRYRELKDRGASPGVVAVPEPVVANGEQKTIPVTSLEPVFWAAGIAIAIILFVFTVLPGRRHEEAKHLATQMSTGQTVTNPDTQKEKLYLEVIALENTWLLVRTDNSPQKKALLQKDESLIWSADERFLLSYGSVKALKLILNGRELIVNEPGNTVVRDLAVIASGIVNRNIQPEKARTIKPMRMPAIGPPLPQPAALMETQGTATVHQPGSGQDLQPKRKPAENQRQFPLPAPEEIQGPPSPPL